MQMKISAISEIQSVETMSLDASGAPLQPLCPEGAAEPVVPCSPAAERMRAHRSRKKNGMRCVMIELHKTEIGALVGKGLLKPEMRNEASAIVDAIYSYFDRELK